MVLQCFRNGSLKDLIHSVKAQGLEGLVAKRRDSKYDGPLGMPKS
jgi:ATP-dependent DNA ligase